MKHPQEIYVYVKINREDILNDPDHAYERAVTVFVREWEKHVTMVKEQAAAR